MKRKRATPDRHPLTCIALQRLQETGHARDCVCRDYLPWLRAHENTSDPAYRFEGGSERIGHEPARTHARCAAFSYLRMQHCMDRDQALQLYDALLAHMRDKHLAFQLVLDWWRITTSAHALEEDFVQWWVVKHPAMRKPQDAPATDALIERFAPYERAVLGVQGGDGN